MATDTTGRGGWGWGGGRTTLGLKQYTVGAAENGGCHTQHAFAESGVNLLGADDDDSEQQVQGPPHLDGGHVS